MKSENLFTAPPRKIMRHIGWKLCLAFGLSFFLESATAQTITYNILAGSTYHRESTHTDYTLSGTITAQLDDLGGWFRPSVTDYSITGLPFTWQNPPEVHYGPTFGTLGDFNKTTLVNEGPVLIVGNPAYDAIGSVAPGEYGRFQFTTGSSNSYTGSITSPITISLIGLGLDSFASNGPLQVGDTLTLYLGNGASAIPEPSTYATIVGAVALGGVMLWRRRERRVV